MSFYNEQKFDKNMKVVIENICDSEENFSDDNMNNLLNCYSQLSVVNKNPNAAYFDLMRKQLKTNINKSKYVLIVKHDHNIIGTGSILIENKIIRDMKNVGHIEDIVIDSKYRGYGYAKNIINELIKIGSNNNCYKIILDCSDEMNEFYEKLGFKKSANNMRLNL